MHRHFQAATVLEGRQGFPFAGLRIAIVRATPCRWSCRWLKKRKQVAKGSRFHPTIHMTVTGDVVDPFVAPVQNKTRVLCSFYARP
jgi:hypothetical protein